LKKTDPDSKNIELRVSWSKLVPHSTDFAWAHQFNVEVRVSEGKNPHTLQATFKVTGPIPDLSLPVEVAEKRMTRNQELWRHSCFEIFASPPGSDRYFEWNLTSSLEWGHFEFQNYRVASGDALSLESGIETLKFSITASNLELNVTLELEKFPELFEAVRSHQKIKLGLTCILENKKGERSYWALTHSEGKADFHRAESFTLSFP
jgi:hypothetical protein